MTRRSDYSLGLGLGVLGLGVGGRSWRCPLAVAGDFGCLSWDKQRAQRPPRRPAWKSWPCSSCGCLWEGQRPRPARILHEGRGGVGGRVFSLQPPKHLLLLNPEEDTHPSFLWDADSTCLTFTGNHFSHLFQLSEELLPGTLYGPAAQRCDPPLHTRPGFRVFSVAKIALCWAWSLSRV